MTNTKATPKSCSCEQCSRGARTKHGHFMHHYADRQLRQLTRLELQKDLGDVSIPPASHGGYTD